MAIVKMKKIRLLALRSQKDDLLRELMLMGCVEVSEPDELLEDPELTAIVKRESAELDSFRSDYITLTRALDIIKQYAPVKTKLFALRPEISDSRLLDESDSEACLELAKKLEHLDSRIRRLSTEENNDKSLIEALTPWSGLKLSLDSEGTPTAALIIGAVPASVDTVEMQRDLQQTVEESQLFVVSSNKEQHYLTVVCLRDKQQAVSDVLRRYSFSVSSLKNLHGTAEDNIKHAEQRLREQAEEKAGIIEQIVEASAQKSALQLCYDHIGTKIARAEAAEKLIGTSKSVLLTGWMTAPSEKELAQKLENYVCAWELEDPSPDESANVPVKLKNNFLTRPLMMVTEMYSLPAYDGIDPNPLIMPFYSVFFGIMYADMGYGAVLIILGLLGSIFMRPRGMMKYALGLLKLCGTTTFIFGFLFGSFFGDLIPVLTDLLGITHRELWSMVDPLAEPMLALIASLAIGMFHIMIGMAINAYMLIRDGKWYDAVFDVFTWWLLFAGIAVGALGHGWYVCIAGAASLVLTQGRSKPSIAGKIISGVASLYDITGYLGDVLSYSRLMALLMAGSVIGSVFNMLGALTGSIFAFTIVFLFGHILNMGLNIIGTYVHAARLQYLEFFGKFYKDGGRAFAPLQIKTKYHDMIKEEK